MLNESMEKKERKWYHVLSVILKFCLSERRCPIYYNVGGNRGRSKMIAIGKITENHQMFLKNGKMSFNRPVGISYDRVG